MYLSIFRVSRDVDLRHALARNAVHIGQGIEIVVLRGHVDVVDIQQNAAVRALHHFAQELPFRHLALVKFGIAAHVLDDDGNLEKVLHLADGFAVTFTASQVYGIGSRSCV